MANDFHSLKTLVNKIRDRKKTRQQINSGILVFQTAEREVLRSKREGFGVAAHRLYREAKCPLVFFTDSDGQYVAEDFWLVAKLHNSKTDMVHGYKVARKDSAVRLYASRFFNALARRSFKVDYHDINSAFRLVSRQTVISILPEMKHLRTLFNTELFLRMVALGVTVEEIGVRHRKRRFGESRGLPPNKFIAECCSAWLGLRRLRRELTR